MRLLLALLSQWVNFVPSEIELFSYGGGHNEGVHPRFVQAQRSDFCRECAALGSVMIVSIGLFYCPLLHLSYLTLLQYDCCSSEPDLDINLATRGAVEHNFSSFSHLKSR